MQAVECSQQVVDGNFWLSHPGLHKVTLVIRREWVVTASLMLEMIFKPYISGALLVNMHLKLELSCVTFKEEVATTESVAFSSSL